MSDAYSILGVSHTATPSEIRRAYYRLALLVHPDKLPPSAAPAERASAEERFKLIASAYCFPQRRCVFVANLIAPTGTRFSATLTSAHSTTPEVSPPPQLGAQVTSAPAEKQSVHSSARGTTTRRQEEAGLGEELMAA